MSCPQILLVEDNEDTAAALAMLLEHRGYAVHWTESVASTVERVRRGLRLGEPPPDVVVLDLMLPDGSGPELIERLRVLGPGPPVIVHSAAAEWVLRAAAERMRAVAALRKPIETTELLRAIEHVVHVTHGPPEGPQRSRSGSSIQNVEPARIRPPCCSTI